MDVRHVILSYEMTPSLCRRQENGIVDANVVHQIQEGAGLCFIIGSQLCVNCP